MDQADTLPIHDPYYDSKYLYENDYETDQYLRFWAHVVCLLGVFYAVVENS